METRVNEHITVEEFQKCEILRKHGYTINVYNDTVESHVFGRSIQIKRLIAYKEDIQYIPKKFAEEHLLENVFDEFVVKGE